MSVTSVAKILLEADVTLVAAATGGIWDFAETKHTGINRTTTPTAFDSYGIVKPCVLLKERSAIPDGSLMDDGNQYKSARIMLECWFYEDAGYSNIETMRDRVYALLNAQQLSGTFQVHWAGDIRTGFRDVDLDAYVERSDYRVQVKKSV